MLGGILGGCDAIQGLGDFVQVVETNEGEDYAARRIGIGSVKTSAMSKWLPANQVVAQIR